MAKIRVFVSYSHEDEPWKERLVRQLRVLEPEGLDVWEDRRIAGGDDWLPEIEQAIARCDVALLLVSANFLNSPFILGREVTPLLQRREQQGIRVIPVILSPCPWTRVSWLKPIQARPKGSKALSGMHEHDAESALVALVDEIAALADAVPETGVAGQPLPPDRVELTRLPAGALGFLGRTDELAALDAAWESAGQTAIVELIAPGGTGKTALTKYWTEGLKAAGWRGARRVFGWSFYSQGTSDDRQASEDHFLAQAIAWFGVAVDPALNAADKGRALAQAVTASRTLLVLDGLEPLQYPPGPLAGQLRAPGVQALLTHLATAGQPGLCLISSRVWVKDLDEWVRSGTHPQRAVQRIDLGNLDAADGARLLHAEGATRAGEAPITPDDAELRAASDEVKGHALTLSLLGRYLALAFDGDIRRRDAVKFREADAETTGGRVFRVIEAYERWFGRQGRDGARELATLRLLGFFDRPATAAQLGALTAAPEIPGLSEALVELSPVLWRATLKRLHDNRLIERVDGDGCLDAHPLVREYFADRLAKALPEAWREGHRRLYEHLKSSVPHRPDGLAGLQPLYQAVAHGCRAGLYEEALHGVYIDRILRGRDADGFYSSRRLAAIGADLGAVACFFVEPWLRTAPELNAGDQAWLQHQAAYRLRALGRLREALAPMRTGAEMRVAQAAMKNAATAYGNLSQLLLGLGRIDDAIADARRAVSYATTSEVVFLRMARRADLADALHHRGDCDEARLHFEAAEEIQAQNEPDRPQLYALQGVRYCDLLLVEAERAAWRGACNQTWVDTCNVVGKRASQALQAAERNEWLLRIALDQLTLARCAFYSDRLRNRPVGQEARQHCEAAVDGLRKSAALHHLPRGLLTRAWLRQSLGDMAGASADLDEAQRIASRGGMKLHLADVHLTRARLFRDRSELAKARVLIDECGYGRRLPEFDDAQARAQREGWV